MHGRASCVLWNEREANHGMMWLIEYNSCEKNINKTGLYISHEGMYVSKNIYKVGKLITVMRRDKEKTGTDSAEVEFNV